MRRRIRALEAEHELLRRASVASKDAGRLKHRHGMVADLAAGGFLLNADGGPGLAGAAAAAAQSPNALLTPTMTASRPTRTSSLCPATPDRPPDSAKKP